MKGITVIICCYNSANRLPETLKHVASQIIPTSLPWEVIIVNNNSKDNTVEVALSEWNKYSQQTPFRVVNEMKQGLFHARVKGVIESKFECILFVDDDNWLEENYINYGSKLMFENPQIGILCGNIIARTECDAPFWFSSYSSWYACGSQWYKEGDISHKTYAWGAGIFIRKEIFSPVLYNNFSPFTSGRSGTEILSGDDSEISKWALLMNFKLWYSPQLQLTHFIPQERVNTLYLEKLFLAIEKSNYWLDKYNILIRVKSYKYSKLKSIIKGFKLFIKSIISNSNNRRTYAQFLLGDIIRVSSKDDYTFLKESKKIIKE